MLRPALIRHWLNKARARARKSFAYGMSAEPWALSFICVICGAPVSAAVEAVHGRETISCPVCRSTLRFRALVAALQQRMFGCVRAMPELPVRKDLSGLGMSDAALYGEWLREKFEYTNTFFHTRPFLDICDPGREFLGRHDFVVSSDVMEHVLPPVEVAFGNLHSLLKRGGTLVLTVPCIPQGRTREHYPELYRYEVSAGGEGRKLTNVTRDGRVQVFDDLVFHGGDGATLEMRVFARGDLVGLLQASGFRDIRIHHEDMPEWGIVNADDFSLPMTAVAG